MGGHLGAGAGTLLEALLTRSVEAYEKETGCRYYFVEQGEAEFAETELARANHARSSEPEPTTDAGQEEAPEEGLGASKDERTTETVRLAQEHVFDFRLGELPAGVQVFGAQLGVI